MTVKLCEIDGCARFHRAKGLCNMHYERVRSTGAVGPVHGRQGRRLAEETGFRTCRFCQASVPVDTCHPGSVFASGRAGVCKPCHRVKRFLETSNCVATSEEVRIWLSDRPELCESCSAAPGAHIDHCHETGKLRGLLCLQCNVMLGMAKDDPERLRRGAVYLESHLR